METLKTVLNSLGGKWTFFVIGEFSCGDKRFTEIANTLEINTKSLSDTLKKLENSGWFYEKLEIRSQ